MSMKYELLTVQIYQFFSVKMSSNIVFFSRIFTHFTSEAEFFIKEMLDNCMTKWKNSLHFVL